MKNYKLATRGEPRGEILLSRPQVAEKLGLSIDSLKRMEKTGQLKPIKLNSRVVRYRLSDIEAMTAAHEVAK